MNGESSEQVYGMTRSDTTDKNIDGIVIIGNSNKWIKMVWKEMRILVFDGVLIQFVQKLYRNLLKISLLIKWVRFFFKFDSIAMDSLSLSVDFTAYEK